MCEGPPNANAESDEFKWLERDDIRRAILDSRRWAARSFWPSHQSFWVPESYRALQTIQAEQRHPDLLSTSEQLRRLGFRLSEKALDDWVAAIQGIEALNLVKDYDGNRVLHGLNFEVRKGEITGFLGPNGAGKTTTLRIISTLLAPTSGRVRVEGLDVQDRPEAVRHKLGLLTEEPGLYDQLTVREQLMFAAGAYGINPDVATERIETLAELLMMDTYLDGRAGTLSKGTRQKAALARALLHDPEVVLLDEPTSSLDVATSASLQEFISGPTFAEKTVLISTHLLDEVERLCHSVVGISDGRVIVAKSTQEIATSAGAKNFREGFLNLLDESRTKPWI